MLDLLINESSSNFDRPVQCVSLYCSCVAAKKGVSIVRTMRYKQSKVQQRNDKKEDRSGA